MKNIEFNGFGADEVKIVTPIMKDLLKSYIEKPKDMELVDWIKSQLEEHLPNNKIDMVEQISSDIICKINKFNNNMVDIGQYCSQGKTRQEWLYNQIKQVPEGMDINSYGNYLSQVENGLSMGNQITMDAVKSNNGGVITVNELSAGEMANIENNAEWNKYKLKDVASNIVEQANLAGLGNIAIPTGINLGLQATHTMDLPESNIKMEEIELNSAVDNGMKAVASTALEICLNEGKIPFLRKFIPIGAAANVACLGVESVKAITKFASGQTSARQTVEHLSRAVTSVLADFISSKATISMCSAIPVIGPVLGTTLGTLVMSMSNQQIRQYIHMGIQKLQPIAISVLNTAHKVVSSGVNLVKNVGNKIASFLGF